MSGYIKSNVYFVEKVSLSTQKFKVIIYCIFRKKKVGVELGMGNVSPEKTWWQLQRGSFEVYGNANKRKEEKIILIYTFLLRFQFIYREMCLDAHTGYSIAGVDKQRMLISQIEESLHRIRNEPRERSVNCAPLSLPLKSTLFELAING